MYGEKYPNDCFVVSLLIIADLLMAETQIHHQIYTHRVRPAARLIIAFRWLFSKLTGICFSMLFTIFKKGSGIIFIVYFQLEQSLVELKIGHTHTTKYEIIILIS